MSGLLAEAKGRMDVSNRLLESFGNHPLVHAVREQRSVIGRLMAGLELAERRERDAGVEIARLKRQIAELQSQREKV